MAKVVCLLFLLSAIFSFSPSNSTNSPCNPLYIAAFNIRIFGVTKASKSDVMSVLANITLRYDVMLVQEIRDSSMTAIYQLLNLVNSRVTDGDVYNIEISERTGRTSSKEQYCFFYRTSRVSVVNTHQYNDSVNDYFEREPFSVLFEHNCSMSVCEKFWLQAIHTKPTEAISEINSLYLYSFPATSSVFNSSQGLVLGDLNGDCSYVSDSAALTLQFELDSNFTFLFSKGDIDTTLSSTHCTYDNFVIPSNMAQFIPTDSPKIFDFMTYYGLTQDFAEDVSDHYPIELRLDLEKCSAATTMEPTTDPDLLINNCSILRIAAFNIRIFGVTKASKSDVMSVLANITLRYDVMLVQEIRDSSMTAIYQLLNLVNSRVTDGDVYNIEISERTGRTSSKEQYCFFYRTSRVSVVNTHQYNDSVNDYFEREPFSVLFEHNCSMSVCEKFWLQAIHTKPTEAISEINSLYLYSFPATSSVFNSSQGLVLGDLNGDCSYVSDSAALTLQFELDSNFTFLFNKGDIDTTLSSTHCTYDNFVIHNDLMMFLIPDSIKVFNIMTSFGLSQDFAAQVSDHHPIELELEFKCQDNIQVMNTTNSLAELSMLFTLFICFTFSIFSIIC
ncbi:hypothetical protein LOD99_3469 [Oopsacas minuta]|uniref:Endonuclease/exonuclease/phosphatase domain-containing protein n=1 Tax=Oopsacas minuta TaxID=111878 RepID=A0AAV7JYP2_9METZ|nr:hypothetical protein LOD99_3469 [Oopsacas minuta]